MLKAAWPVLPSPFVELQAPELKCAHARSLPCLPQHRLPLLDEQHLQRLQCCRGVLQDTDLAIILSYTKVSAEGAPNLFAGKTGQAAF